MTVKRYKDILDVRIIRWDRSGYIDASLQVIKSLTIIILVLLPSYYERSECVFYNVEQVEQVLFIMVRVEGHGLITTIFGNHSFLLVLVIPGPGLIIWYHEKFHAQTWGCHVFDH